MGRITLTEYFNSLREDGSLTPLPEVAALLRPLKVYANYALLYRLCANGDLISVREPKTRRVFVVGDADYIAEQVKKHFSYHLGRWRPQPEREFDEKINSLET